MNSESLMINCPCCHHLYSQRAPKCNKCNWPTTAKCNICNNQIPASSEACPYCGDPDPFSESTCSKTPSVDNSSARLSNPERRSQQRTRSREIVSDLQVGSILLSLTGRISRQQFWNYLIITQILIALCYIPFRGNFTSDTVILMLPLIVPLTWSSWAIGVKRCHDRNKSGLWLCLGAVPIIGTLWYILELGLKEGTVGPNRFGEDPLSSPFDKIDCSNALSSETVSEAGKEDLGTSTDDSTVENNRSVPATNGGSVGTGAIESDHNK